MHNYWVMAAFPRNHLLVVVIMIFMCNVRQATSCLEGERQALLMFKGGLVDESNRLGSWVDVGGGNCCNWYGVSCNNSTGHVIGLHLQPEKDDPELFLSYEAHKRTQLSGRISPWILHLKQLVHLNLSQNDFGQIQIPPFLGLMTSLKQLDLSDAGFGGKIPSQIGNLTNLDDLRLAQNIISSDSLSIDSLQWVSSLSLLHHLDLSGANLSKSRDWLHSINTIPSLSELILSGCDLAHPYSVPLLNNLSSLVVLDLSGNFFDKSSPIPKWIFQLHNLNTLDLSLCNFQPGPIPEGPQNLSRLRSLDLSDNNFNSTIPKWIFQLHNLNTLDLSECKFQPGPIPEGLQNLSRLRSLDLSYNNFNSTIPSWLYGFSSGLEILHLERNSLQGMISSAIGNLTSLSYLELRSNSELEIGGRETTKSMGQLCQLKHLGLSGMKVNPDVADFFRDLFSSCPSNGLEVLDLSSSGISGNLTEVSFQWFESLVHLYLSNNSISGSIPTSFGELQSLEEAYLDGNSMVGSVSEAQFAKLARLETFDAGGNKLELKASPSWIPPFQLTNLDLSSWQLGKELPPWLHSQKKIVSLEMSGCGFEGPIPEWFQNMSVQLGYVDLSNNQLKGEVPNIFSSPTTIEILDLSNNSFESLSKGFWNFPGSLAYLNLSYNQIVGEIPSGHALEFMDKIDLRSNKFQGRIPPFSSNLEIWISQIIPSPAHYPISCATK